MNDVTWLYDAHEDAAIANEAALEAAGLTEPVEDTPLTFEEIFGDW